MSRRRWERTLILSAILTMAGAARAQPMEGEKRAAAQALFEAARKLTGEGKYADACPKLQESYRIDPAIGTKFYLAECYEHIGRLASAWTYYLEVVEDAHREGAKDREKFASQRAEALKPRLPRLVIKPSTAVRVVSGLAVQRDGMAVGEGMWDTPVPVDLGPHTIRVTAPKKKPLELQAEVKQEGGEFPVEIPMLEDLPTTTPGDMDIAPPPHTEPRPPKPVSPAQRIAGFVTGGVGVVSLGGGIGFGVQAIAKKNESNAGGKCDAENVCNVAGHQLRLDGIRAATASTVLFAVGGAAVVTGIVLIATAPKRSAQGNDATSASVSVGPLGVLVRGRF